MDFEEISNLVIKSWCCCVSLTGVSGWQGGCPSKFEGKKTRKTKENHESRSHAFVPMLNGRGWESWRPLLSKSGRKQLQQQKKRLTNDHNTTTTSIANISLNYDSSRARQHVNRNRITQTTTPQLSNRVQQQQRSAASWGPGPRKRKPPLIWDHTYREAGGDCPGGSWGGGGGLLAS